MTPEELELAVTDGTIDTVMVAFTDHYGRLLGKRFDAEFFIEDGLANGTHSCNYLLTVDMEMEPVPGYRYASWEQGYGDFHLVPDLSTLCIAGWAERTALVLCDVVDDSVASVASVASNGADRNVSVAPRSILRNQLDQLAQHGRRAMAASELEFYLYNDSYRQANTKNYSGLESAGHYIEDYHLLQGARVESYVGEARRALRRTGIPVENTKGEWGHGQHELNVRFADALTMADRHTIMKHGMKELADSLGVSVTFMAKPTAAEAGNSCHIHLSLWDDTATTNTFVGPSEPSDEFRWFLGGWMAHVDDFMVCYAPTINSYKRYVDGSWAPTRIAWSQDNRTAGFRIVGGGQGLRIECRIPGADCNPYMAYAATIASGLAGIKERIEPPEPFAGDVYQARDLPRVARSLEQAVDAFAASSVARGAFGDDVVDHYAHFHRVEIESFSTAVTDWERRRYFERI